MEHEPNIGHSSRCGNRVISTRRRPLPSKGSRLGLAMVIALWLLSSLSHCSGICILIHRKVHCFASYLILRVCPEVIFETLSVCNSLGSRLRLGILFQGHVLAGRIHFLACVKLTSLGSRCSLEGLTWSGSGQHRKVSLLISESQLIRDVNHIDKIPTPLHVLLVRIKSQVVSTQRCGYRWAGIMESVLEICLSQGQRIFPAWQMLLWTGVSVSWAWQWFTVRSVSLVIWIGILELPLMPFPVLSPEVSLCVPVYPYSTQAPGLQLATCPASLERVPLSPSGLLSRIHEDPHRGKSRSHLAHQEQSHVFPSQILGMPGSQYEKLSCSCCERPAITSLTFWVSQAWVNRCYSVHPAAERTH